MTENTTTLKEILMRPENILTIILYSKQYFLEIHNWFDLYLIFFLNKLKYILYKYIIWLVENLTDLLRISNVNGCHRNICQNKYLYHGIISYFKNFTDIFNISHINWLSWIYVVIYNIFLVIHTVYKYPNKINSLKKLEKYS